MGSVWDIVIPTTGCLPSGRLRGALGSWVVSYPVWPGHCVFHLATTLRENAMRQGITTIAMLMTMTAAAHAQDRCTRASSPSDVLPVEDCTGCPTPAADAFFRTLNRLSDENTIP